MSPRPAEIPRPAALPQGEAGPAFLSAAAFSRESFGPHHPLSIPRHAGLLELCRLLGWLEPGAARTCRAATVAELQRFHRPGYVRALRRADRSGMVSVADRERYNIGTMENPLFPGLFERAATTVGGSILAAELALAGHTAFHPAGGTHHGRPGRASGFCYFNDPAFAILTLLDGGLARVMYVDLDAHHGDGVQDAFAGDARVFTLSVHEEGRWPFSGPAADRGGGQSRNLPVPGGFNDSELDFLLQSAVLPLVDSFAPEALVVTCGADALRGDPLSRLAISNGALWSAVAALRAASPRTVVLGGGGYNPWTTVRCWAGLWGVLSGQPIPDGLPRPARALLEGFHCELLDEDEVEADWVWRLRDAPNPGEVRAAVRAVARQVVN